MFNLCKNRNEKGAELRGVVASTFDAMMNENDKIVVLEADLGGASKLTSLAKTHPDRFVQCGIAEADMVGIACGLSSEGFVPFVHSFGPFLTRRAFDQIFLSGAYAKNTLNLYGTDPGFTVGANGGTHTTFEDVGLMRMIPNAVICDSADAVQLEWIIREFAKMEGIHYVRANRKDVRNVYEPGSTFEIGKGNVIREGKDVLVITAGQIVSDALDCAEKLAAEGIDVEVIDMFCIKPLDKELVKKAVAGKKAVVTFENHSIYGGLGSSVAELLAEEGIAVPFKRHGIDEQFGQVGSPDFLQKEFKLTAEGLESVIKAVLK